MYDDLLGPTNKKVSGIVLIAPINVNGKRFGIRISN